MIETMTAVDDFESFTNFMDNAVAGEDAHDDGYASRGDEEGKRSYSEDSGRGSQSSADDATTSRRK